jgi:RHS repeat-associated protein
MKGRRTAAALIAAELFLILGLVPSAIAQTSTDNPGGPTGIYTGNITTAGEYQPFSGNQTRVVEDLAVPGSVGASPLKWTRYYNTTVQDGQWTFSYKDYQLTSGWSRLPNGLHIPASGMPDYSTFEPGDCSIPYSCGVFYLGDGSKVTFESELVQEQTGSVTFYRPTKVIDPYGQITTLTYTTRGYYGTPAGAPPAPIYVLDRVTEPGGRYFQLTWADAPPGDGAITDQFRNVISKVEAFDGQGNSLGSVSYSWISMKALNNTAVPLLDHATYADGTIAHYTYTKIAYPLGGGSQVNVPVLQTADDVRYDGAMRQIAYGTFDSSGNLFFDFNTESNLHTHELLTAASSAGSDTQQVNGTWVMTYTSQKETRADGAIRTFTYKHPCTWTNPIRETLECDDNNFNKLISYTDFVGNSTQITYYDEAHVPYPSGGGFIQSVTDLNGHTTTYVRDDAQHHTWNVTQIQNPDGSTIEQTYTDYNFPYFLASRTAPHFNGDPVYTTSYTRDANHRITRKDYPDGTYETFAYNNFGEVLTHRMGNGAYQHFSYDARGLLLSKTNPTWNSDHDNSLTVDPKTVYSYYTSGPWADRIQQETDPRGMPTSYDYDRAYDANGENSGASTAQAAVAGRGLVTRITHSDGTYRSFGYNQYGDKVWEENELRQRTKYTNDEYGRVTSIEDPLHHITTHDYRKGGTLSATATTFREPFSTTLPAGETTQTIYDPNWRKTAVTQVNGSSNPTAHFFYDTDPITGYQFIGQLLSTQDPNGNYTHYTYDSRDRKVTTTDPLGHTVATGYDARSNVHTITRTDGSVETKEYDSMNRVLTDTVPKTGTASAVAEWVTTTFQYYPGNATQMAGQLKKIIDGKNQATTFEYDPAGVRTKMMYPLDANQNSDPNQYQSWTYDSDHNLIARRTVNGVAQLFGYDSRNRQISTAWSNALDWASFGYDDASRMISAQNPTSTITRTYDDAGRVTLDRQQFHISAITAVSRKTHGSVGTFDVALPLTGKAGVECRWGQGTSHDQHQIIVTFPRAVSFAGASVTTGTGSVSSTSQSADHTQIILNLSGVTNGQTIIATISGVTDGNVTNDVTVGMGVLLGDTNADGYNDSIDTSQVKSQAGNPVTSSNFREDLNCDGFIDSIDTAIVKSKSGTSLPSSSPLTQPGSTGPNFDVQYSYDSSNKNTRLYVTSAGYDYTFGYDAIGRFQTISAGASQLFGYGYDSASNVTDRTNLANGVNQHYIIDALNRIQERDLVRAGSAFAYEVYGYEAQRPGLMTSVDREDAKHDAFGYDLLPEMTSAQYGLPDSGGMAQRMVGYTWDKAGNRLTMTDTAGPSCFYQTTSLNQYWTDGINMITNGSEHEMASYQNVNYTHINDTHLQRINGTDVFGQQSTYEMYYDALGRRVVTVLNGSTTYYVNDGEKAILEYRGWSVPSAANVYGKGIDEILMRTDYTQTPALTFYYQDDHEGSITHLTSGTGQVLESYRYDAFGKPGVFSSTSQQLNASAFNNRFMFTGREYVANFGVYEYRNRAYHPGLGRFMSEDPKLFDAGDNNFFRYVGNDPVDRVDPMGLAPLPEPPAELDQASVEAARQCLTISSKNTDNQGYGWERGKSIWYSPNETRISNDSSVGKGTQFKGPQTITDWPDFGEGPNVSHAHNHTNTTKVDVLTNKPSKNGVVMDKGDREGGDKAKGYYYVIDGSGKIIERYRQSQDDIQRGKHADWALDRRDPKTGKWKEIKRVPAVPIKAQNAPQASHAEPSSNIGSDGILSAGQVIGGLKVEGLNAGGAP